MLLPPNVSGIFLAFHLGIRKCGLLFRFDFPVSEPIIGLLIIS